MTRRGVLVVALVGLSLLTLAWIGATRPFGAPDENAHYLRALGIANGQLLGPVAPYRDPVFPPAAQAWQHQDARAVLVAPRMTPVPRGVAGAQPEYCLSGRLNTAGRGCYMATYTGDYPPISYLLPAAALRVASNAGSGLWIGRLLSCAACALLLTLAAAVLWNGDPLSILGLLVAATPMVFFVSSVIGPSGLESASALAFAAAGLRLTRDGDRAPGWLFALLGVSGAVLILAWQLGLVFAALQCVVFVLLADRPTEWRTNRDRLRVGLVSASLLLAAALAIAWDAYAGVAHSHIQILPLSSLKAGVDQLDGVFHQWVGQFGWLTIQMRSVFAWVWWLVTLLLLGIAAVLSPRRERAALIVVTAVAVGFPILFFAWTYRFSGFPLQGRYFIPLVSLVPLVAGECVTRSDSATGQWVVRLPLALSGAAVAVIGLAGWWTAAKAAANGHSHIWFAVHTTWHPPLGWWPWLIAAAAGALCLLVTALGVLRGPACKRSPSGLRPRVRGSGSAG